MEREIKRTFYFVDIQHGDQSVSLDELHIGETTIESVCEATVALRFPTAAIHRRSDQPTGEYTITGEDNGVDFAVVVRRA